MAAPTFRSAGTPAATVTSNADCTPGAPAGAADGDILILFSGARLDDDTADKPVITANGTGWTEIIYGFNDLGSYGFHIRAWWYRVSGSVPTMPTIQSPDVNAVISAQVAAYSGCIASGTPYEDPDTNISSGLASWTGVAVTTTGVDRRIVQYWFADDDTPGNPDTGWTEDYEQDFTSPDSFTVALDSITKATSGTQAAPTRSNGNERNCNVGFALIPAASSTDVEIVGNAGSYLWTGYAGTVSATTIISSAVTGNAGSYLWTGYAGTVSATTSISAAIEGTAGSYLWTGYAGTVVAGTGALIEGAAGSYLWTGYAGTVVADQAIEGTAGSYLWTGYAGTVVAGTGALIEGNAGSYLWTGYQGQMILGASAVLEGNAGSYLWTGYAGTVVATNNIAITGSAGSYEWTGYAATLQVDEVIAGTAGSYEWSGWAGGVVPANPDTRTVYYAESLSEETNATTTYENKTTITFTPEANSTYAIFFVCEAGFSDADYGGYFRLEDITNSVVLRAVGLNQADAGGVEYHTVGGGFKVVDYGASPSSVTYAVRWRSEDAGKTTKIKNARIMAVKLGEAEQRYQSETGFATPSTGLALTLFGAENKVTLAPGDYVILASADISNNSGAYVTTVALYDGTTEYGKASIKTRAMGSGYTGQPYMWSTVLPLTVGSSTDFTIRFGGDGTHTSAVNAPSIIALDLSQFTNSYTAADATVETTTSTSYVDALTLTETPDAADHIVFAGGIHGNNTATDGSDVLLLEDATEIQESIRNAVTTDVNQFPFFTFYKDALANTSITWKLQQAIRTGGTGSFDEMGIAVIQTEVVGSIDVAITGTAGSYTWTGYAGTVVAGTGAVITGTAGSYLWTGYQGTVVAGTGAVIEGTAGSYLWTGQQGSIVVEEIIEGTAGSYLWTGYAGTVATGTTAEVVGDAGSYLWTGYAGTVVADAKITGTAGSYLWTGYAGTLSIDEKITGTAGSYLWTGQQGTLVAGTGAVIVGAAGNYTWTGYAGALVVDEKITGTAGAYAWAGYAGTVVAGTVGNVAIVGTAGSYLWTGAQGSLTVDEKIEGAAGSYLWTGQQGALSVDEKITGDAGSYEYTGQQGTVTAGNAAQIVGDAGSYEWTGAQGTISVDEKITGDSNVYEWTGQQGIVATTKSVVLVGDASTYTWIGAAGNLVCGIALQGNAGVLQWTGYQGRFTSFVAAVANDAIFTADIENRDFIADAELPFVASGERVFVADAEPFFEADAEVRVAIAE